VARKPTKNPAAVALGRKGGLARKKKLSKEELSDQGRKAVLARWQKKRAAAEKEKSR